MAPSLISPAFLAGSLLVIIIPGPDLALITRLVLTRGRLRPAMAAAMGMVTAGAVQMLVGALGLSALLAARPSLFATLRWAGAVVLIGMAALALRSALRRPRPARSSGRCVPVRRTFLQGLLCTGTNPKVGVFLMAFLPQFVPPGVDPVRGVALLATVYLGLGLLWLLIWMTMIDRFTRRVQTPAASRIADGCAATVFTVFAVRLCLGG